MKHIARKRFGQNFLIDQSVIADIVRLIGVDDHDVTVEIGPGLGALTMPLLDAVKGQHSAPLHVIELDRDLVARFRGKAQVDELIVHQGDALDFDFGALASTDKQLRLVGNLPYNISSPLLFHLVQFASRVRDQHFMLQREVVERMTAVPGDGAFGRLSVMLQVHYQMSNLLEVPPQAFNPPPKVFSAIVRMIPDARLAAQILDHRHFAELVTQAFSQRRKMLRNTLARYASIVPFEAAGIEPTARAEDIAPEAYVCYANLITKSAAL